MAFYAWRGEAFDSPILTISPKNMISIVADVHYDRCFQNYDFKVVHVRIEKLDEKGKDTGKQLTVSFDFIEEIFEITPEELSNFMAKKYREDKLEAIGGCDDILTLHPSYRLQSFGD